MKELAGRVIDLTIQIQQIAAPTFQEDARAEFVQDLFLAESLEDVSMDDCYNVFGRIPGQSDCLPLIVSAHLDTVFPATTPLTAVFEPGKITAPGIGDNSLGVAGLFGLIWILRTQKKFHHGDIWLVANSCEEGLGDLRGMRKVVDRFGNDVQAYLILEGMALGQIYNRGLGVKRYRISTRTRGGHSWVDYGAASAIHEMARLIAKLTELELPRKPRTTLNVGTVSGGTSINTIAPQAQFDLDLRSEEPNTLIELAVKIEELVRSCQREDVVFQVETIGDRPAGGIPEHHPLVRLAIEAVKSAGIEPGLNIGSTDANIPLSLGYPAVTIGLSNGCGAHTTHETLFTAPVESGLTQLEHLVRGIFA